MRFMVFALTAFAFSTDAAQKADLKRELELLQGTWRVVAVEIDGKSQPREKSPKEIVIAGNKLSGIGPEMTMTLDPTKKPKWMDLTFKKEDKDYPVKAIYEIEGDKLKLCIPLAPVGKMFENKRPESFDTAGKAVALFKAERAAKERVDPIKQELKALQGTWTLEFYEYEGKRLSRKATIKWFEGEDRWADLRIEGDKIIWAWPDRSTEYTPLVGAKPKENTYSFDPKKSPKTVDIHYVASGFLGGRGLGTIRGIYRVKGDRLEVCCRPLSRTEEERPKDFTTDDNDSDRLVIYRRGKGPAK
jgi:uncharacterized protein (TIGR03067 family)